jgi:uncharacterized OB-fold protein
VPETDGLDAPYWDGTRRGELCVQRCGGCGGWQWGPEWLCHRCLGFDLQWVAVAPHGRIYSWERAWHPVIRRCAVAAPTSWSWSSSPTRAAFAWSAISSAIQQEVTIGAPVEAVFEAHDDATPPFTLVHWRVTR